MCQPCVTRVTLEKGCKRPVHRHCVSVSTYNSKNNSLGVIHISNIMIHNVNVFLWIFRTFARKYVKLKNL